MSNFTALLDASALYSMTITDLVIEMARTGIFRARWSHDIHNEWIRAEVKPSRLLYPSKIEARRAAMDACCSARLSRRRLPAFDPWRRFRISMTGTRLQPQLPAALTSL